MDRTWTVRVVPVFARHNMQRACTHAREAAALERMKASSGKGKSELNTCKQYVRSYSYSLNEFIHFSASSNDRNVAI